MRHTIRNRIINQYGLPTVKVEHVNGELSSGVLDISGREIFEGDSVTFENQTYTIEFRRGTLWCDDIPLGDFDDGELEIVDE